MHNQSVFVCNTRIYYQYQTTEWCSKGNIFFPAWWRPTYSYAAKAAEFGAVWAETSIPQFLHADEAAKHLSDALHRDRREMTWISLTLQPQESSSLAYSVYSDQLTMMSLLDYKDISYSHYAHFTLKQLDIVFFPSHLFNNRTFSTLPLMNCKRMLKLLIPFHWINLNFSFCCWS